MSKHQTIGKQISDIFSSSELVIFYLVLIFSLYKSNIYLSTILIVIILKTIILKPIKQLFDNTKLGKRPPDGFNCNMFNCGGIPNGGGMPSGHMALLGIMGSIVYNIYKNSNNNNYVFMYIFITITTGISRYSSKCHSLPQIVVGYLVGIIIGVIYYFIDELVDKEVDIYHRHRVEFYNYFK